MAETMNLATCDIEISCTTLDKGHDISFHKECVKFNEISINHLWIRISSSENDNLVKSWIHGWFI